MPDQLIDSALGGYEEQPKSALTIVLDAIAEAYTARGNEKIYDACKELMRQLRPTPAVDGDVERVQIEAMLCDYRSAVIECYHSEGIYRRGAAEDEEFQKNRIIAALTQQPANGWRDISEAPKHRNVLVWREDVGEPWVAMFSSESGFGVSDGDDDHEAWISAHGWHEGEEAPTAWQPLPLPPTSQGA